MHSPHLTELLFVLTWVFLRQSLLQEGGSGRYTVSFCSCELERGEPCWRAPETRDTRQGSLPPCLSAKYSLGSTPGRPPLELHSGTASTYSPHRGLVALCCHGRLVQPLSHSCLSGQSLRFPLQQGDPSAFPFRSYDPWRDGSDL